MLMSRTCVRNGIRRRQFGPQSWRPATLLSDLYIDVALHRPAKRPIAKGPSETFHPNDNKRGLGMSLLDWLPVFIAVGVVGVIGLIVALGLIVGFLIRNRRARRIATDTKSSSGGR
jgi:hypothetical protein